MEKTIIEPCNQKLCDMDTAAMGERMFVIGGIDPLGNYLNSVYSAAVDATNGQIPSPGWQAPARR